MAWNLSMYSITSLLQLALSLSRPQVPPGKDIEAPFLSIAKACHKSYEEKVNAFQDACRNY
jgi:hypothetical protein